MKMLLNKKILAYSAGFICLGNFSYANPEVPKKEKTEKEKVEREVFTSPSGFTATLAIENNLALTVIKDKEGKVLAKIKGVDPMSFSPVDDILLVKELTDGDDSRQYLLNIGAGEFTKKGKRTEYVFGGKYVTEARWSSDGKTIILVNIGGIAEEVEDSFKIADYIIPNKEVPKKEKKE